MKRFSIIFLGALAMFMAGCSKDPHTVTSNPDAWIYDASLPVPIRFGVADGPATKSAINNVQDMVDAEHDFGFFALHNNMTSLNGDTGLDMPHNALAECELVTPTTVQFNFENGPYYYPAQSNDNYTFYGYYARVTENVSPQSDRIVIVTDLGDTDILWAKTEAEPVVIEKDGETYVYEGFNSRYIRKSAEEDNNSDGQPDGVHKHPFMSFKHLTACVTFYAQADLSAYAEANPGKDQVKITKVSVLNTVTRARLFVAHKNPALEGTFEQIKTGTISTDVENGELTKDSKSLCDDFFIHPSETITVQLEYEVVSEAGAAAKTLTSEYVLTPEVKSGDLAGQTGFFAGYKYNYNFIVYTPERISIEATVEPYEYAFGGENDFEDVTPEDE